MRPHTYLLTGATRPGRLGYQIALRFLEEGDRLVLSVHRQESDLPDRFPGQVRTCHADFADPSCMERLLDEAGPTDGIVNAASEFLPTGFQQTMADDLRRSLDIHVVAPFLLAQGYAARGKGSSIVHILDSYALAGKGGRVAYRLAKSALAEEVRLLAPVLAPRIRINAVAPGMVIPSPGEEEFAKREAASSPLGKLATVEDVFQAVRYLLGAVSVTGQTIFVDSGAFLR